MIIGHFIAGIQRLRGDPFQILPCSFDSVPFPVAKCPVDNNVNCTTAQVITGTEKRVFLLTGCTGGGGLKPTNPASFLGHSPSWDVRSLFSFDFTSCLAVPVLWGGGIRVLLHYLQSPAGLTFSVPFALTPVSFKRHVDRDMYYAPTISRLGLSLF